MTDHINDGWLYFTNGTDYLKVFCQKISWSPVYEPTTQNLAGGVNIGFDMGTFYLKISAQKIWLNTNTKYENFMTYTKSWQQADSLKIEVSRNGTNKIKLDGTHTTFPCHIMGDMRNIQKMPGNQDVYFIEGVNLIQTGTAS